MDDIRQSCNRNIRRGLPLQSTIGVRKEVPLMLQRMKKSILLSLRPQHADPLFNGSKTAELRRSVPGSEIGDVYVSSPDRILCGGFTLGQVWSGTPDEIREKVERLACVGKEEYFAYFSGCSTAHALEVANVWKFENAVGLHALRNMFAKFAVPQSWRYVRPEEMRSFGRMKRSRVTPG